MESNLGMSELERLISNAGDRTKVTLRGDSAGGGRARGGPMRGMGEGRRQLGIAEGWRD
jgi:hypothetical protein